MDDISFIPELEEVRYQLEVMQLGVDQTELQHDCNLLKRAHDMGIMATLPSTREAKRTTSSAMSSSTRSTSKDHGDSITSDTSTVSHLTPHSSIYCASSSYCSSLDGGLHKANGRNPSFSAYEKYISQLSTVREETGLPQALGEQASLQNSGQSIFSVSTRKSFSGVTLGFRNKMKLRRKPPRIPETPAFCIACHSPFSRAGSLHSLPCGHANCGDCITGLAAQATQNESRMPPACCGRPVPSETLQQVLPVDAQESFLRAVVQFSLPSDARIFCCDPNCRDFIPPFKKIDASMPFTVACLKCQTKVCCTCKGHAHDVGAHCPEDWELLDALKIGGMSSWRRCYQCRKLVELTEVHGPATCDCTAQFCHACGGIWDSTSGCPNNCSREGINARPGDSGQETSRDIEMAREESRRRSAAHPAIKALEASQNLEMQRFLKFRRAAEESVKVRQATSEAAMVNEQVEEVEQTKAAHSNAICHLEDCQIAEELDLRSSLDLATRSVKVRIKHMEAYCDGLGQNPNAPGLPPRVVTEQNLRDLGCQYNLRDDMERQHEAKINMMRDRQAKRMEELMQKHGDELQSLSEGHENRRAKLHEKLSKEHETFSSTFDSRQSRYTARWILALEMQCKDLQEKDGLEYGMVDPPSWPADADTSAHCNQ